MKILSTQSDFSSVCFKNFNTGSTLQRSRQLSNWPVSVDTRHRVTWCKSSSQVLVRPNRAQLSLNTGYFARLLSPGHYVGQHQVSVPLRYLIICNKEVASLTYGYLCSHAPTHPRTMPAWFILSEVEQLNVTSFRTASHACF